MNAPILSVIMEVLRERYTQRAIADGHHHATLIKIPQEAVLEQMAQLRGPGML